MELRCANGSAAGRSGNGGARTGMGAAMLSSTIVKATVGGSLRRMGGIGSVAHGDCGLGTVRALEVVTMEDEPQVHLHEGERCMKFCMPGGRTESSRNLAGADTEGRVAQAR